MALPKYYTPTIEEFHVGFSFEQNNGYEWVERTYEDTSKGIYNLKNALEADSIRVKALDQDDIESLGWKFHGKGVGNWYHLKKVIEIHNHWTAQGAFLRHDETHVTISAEEAVGCGEVLFRGTIKNKSELKMIMRMVGIEV